MRVTKLIREYVEENVNKAFAEKTAEEKEYDLFYKEVHDFISAVSKEITESINEAIENFRITHNIPKEIKIKKSEYTLIKYDDWNAEIRNKSIKARQERDKAKANAIKDILLNLELGATRADLDNMLKNLKAE